MSINSILKMIKEILHIYEEYDNDVISDKDAVSKISKIFLNEHPDKKEDIDKVYSDYNYGNIDSGEYLMRVMNIIEKVYPELYD